MFSRMWHRLVVLIASLAAAFGLAIMAPPAHASPWDSHVHVQGNIDCGSIDTAKWMWWEASNGESGFANLSEWGSTPRWSNIAGATKFIKIQQYHLDLSSVPGDGVTLNYTIGCHNQWLGDSGEFSQSFGVNRPALGATATRHICRDAAMGCVV